MWLILGLPCQQLPAPRPAGQRTPKSSLKAAEGAAAKYPACWGRRVGRGKDASGGRLLLNGRKWVSKERFDSVNRAKSWCSRKNGPATPQASAAQSVAKDGVGMRTSLACTTPESTGPSRSRSTGMRMTGNAYLMYQDARGCCSLNHRRHCIKQHRRSHLVTTQQGDRPGLDGAASSVGSANESSAIAQPGTRPTALSRRFPRQFT